MPFCRDLLSRARVCRSVGSSITELVDASGFRTLAAWTARASAGHWGHAHRRTIRFQALMELAEVEGVWKLIGLTVVDAKLQK